MPCPSVPIEVVVINTYGPNSHIELELSYEYKPGNRAYYTINQWEEAAEQWSLRRNQLTKLGPLYAAQFTFTINAHPCAIVREWRQWQKENLPNASPCYHNCADAVEWFVERFADVKKSSFTQPPFSVNHLCCGIPWLSILPFPVTLPGRVMSNIKAQITAREEEKTGKKLSALSSLSATLSMCFWKKEATTVAEGELEESLIQQQVVPINQ